MINNLSICIVTKNNESTLNDCVDSIGDICKEVLFLDMGSKDDTLKIINQNGYKAFPQKSENKKDNKNNLIYLSKTDWLFFVEPNEKLINGKSEIEKLLDDGNNSYSVFSLKNNIFSKSIRIFNKTKKLFFENPIYENIYDKSVKTGVVLKELEDITIDDEYQRILDWKNSGRLKSQPLYYECCFYIKNEKYDSFFSTAEKYFFLEKNTDLPSYLMIKYYLAMLYFYIKRDFENSIKNIGFCIEKNPTMSEFWCLLGDINFELKKYKKAYYFYENALIIGKSRSNDDDLPIELNKYKEYPEKMKSICKELIQKI